MRVILGERFKLHFKNFPKQDREKIFDFIAYVEQHGLIELKGRNKSSDNVPFDNPNWAARVKHAQDNKLWHYHIGIPCYELSASGDLTSEYLLHYIREDDFIVLVTMTAHPPFELPTSDYLTY